jgi:hypothetical protein
VNSNQIRERWHESTEPFTLQVRDGSRVPVPHPDFMWMPPGVALLFVYDKAGRVARRIDPMHVVEIEEGAPKARRNGKRSR